MAARFRFILFFGVLSLGLLSALFFNLEKKDIEERLQSYARLWEKDLVAQSLRPGNDTLLPKIQQQMMQQHSAVEALKIKIGPHEAHLGSVNCPFQLKPVPVYLNGIRAGQITACVSVQKTLVSAWTRPWSLLFLALLCFGLFFWEVRRAKERLLSLKKDLEIRGLEERNLLARQVAHDLRGPLTALQTIVSCKAVSNSYADLAQDVIHRIHGITHELLKSQKKDVVSENQTEVVSLNKKTLQDLIGVLGQELQLRDPTCEVLVSSREDILIETLNLSVIELSRMVSNVMQNSLEARSNSQTRVVIDVRLRRSQDVVILSIKDNGKGIPEHILPLIFSEGATYGKVNGHGLGLFSAKKLLKSRGGDIQISSLPNVGTEVTLMIPVSLAEDNKSQLVL
jgi:signal transduction histidine kinase